MTIQPGQGPGRQGLVEAKIERLAHAALEVMQTDDRLIALAADFLTPGTVVEVECANTDVTVNAYLHGLDFEGTDGAEYQVDDIFVPSIGMTIGEFTLANRNADEVAERLKKIVTVINAAVILNQAMTLEEVRTAIRWNGPIPAATIDVDDLDAWIRTLEGKDRAFMMDEVRGAVGW